ncbi:alpha/beta hydrolase [Enterococcus sp. OL5]|uniref:alpha/beta hydrolase n=1 Tax=Enterococcus sp. OL5 TaxID=2590214 RepID=UPI00112AA3CC|nr:alpha/beta hydrolase-fold protein [Enterococcus sp. OL5]TPR56898.1 hypothetical protein FJU10_10965 [Enterococcus sp. OL5]
MYLEGSFQSKSLSSPIAYVAVLPEVIDEQTKTVFLLHGFGYDQRSWCLNTPLVQYAKTYNTAFFCPFAGNSFYTDHGNGEDYGQAVGEEFYQVMKETFGVAQEREKTAIVGFSMGGYGAILLGLRYGENYSRIGGFSPAFVFYKKERQEAHYQMVFAKGDDGSENDCLVRYQELRQRKIATPTLELACGVEDPLCEQTEKFFSSVQEMDSAAPISFRKQPGFHDFSLWNSDLEIFLKHFCAS